MIDQNNVGTQNANQPIVGWNPFDLMDNKILESNQINDSSWTQQNVTDKISSDQNWLVPEKIMVEEKWPNDFMKWVVKFFAKIFGQPDPETWEMNKQKINTDELLKTSKDKFGDVMSGVTWFLDKIGNKVEKVTGLDLDAPIKNLEKNKDVPNSDRPTNN